MQLHSSNVLLDKIKELETYVSFNCNNKKSKVYAFLKDIKSIEPNLSVLSLVNYLVEMHRDGLNLNEIHTDVKKTKKIFRLVDKYVKYVESDIKILNLFKDIHSVIIIRLDKALNIYKQEFDLS